MAEKFKHQFLSDKHINNLRSQVSKDGQKGWECVAVFQDQDGVFHAVMKLREE